MDKPKLSVVVPLYNAENYIEQCLESLINQTLKGIEIIVIDDGSTDKSGEIADTYQRLCTNVTVVHQECISQASAVNRGWSMAKGAYITECDADDFCSLRMYEKLYTMADHEADAVVCGFFGVWDNGIIQPNYLNVPDQWKIVNPRTLEGKDQAAVFGKMVLLPAGIYRRDFMLENNIFWREGGQNYEDTNVAFRIKAMAQDYRSINDALYYYRRGNPNSGSATIFDDYAICEQYEEIERICVEHDLPFMDYMNMRRYYDYMWSLSRTPEDRKIDFLIKCTEDFQKHPAKREFFNSDADFRDYCMIKYGAWLEVGVKP